MSDKINNAGLGVLLHVRFPSLRVASETVWKPVRLNARVFTQNVNQFYCFVSIDHHTICTVWIPMRVSTGLQP